MPAGPFRISGRREIASCCCAADDPQPLVATGRWAGEVLDSPRGAGGFGYDPLMYLPALGRTVAELPRELKNAHSHRALACRQMLQLMREAWGL